MLDNFLFLGYNLLTKTSHKVRKYGKEKEKEASAFANGCE